MKVQIVWNLQHIINKSKIYKYDRQLMYRYQMLRTAVICWNYSVLPSICCLCTNMIRVTILIGSCPCVLCLACVRRTGRILFCVALSTELCTNRCQIINRYVITIFLKCLPGSNPQCWINAHVVPYCRLKSRVMCQTTATQGRYPSVLIQFCDMSGDTSLVQYWPMSNKVIFWDNEDEGFAEIFRFLWPCILSKVWREKN